jgi:hypothetical protein
MSVNSKFIDLVHQVWTPEEFEQNELLVVNKGKSIEIAYGILPQKNPATGLMDVWNGWKTGITEWMVGQTNPASIYAVSEALNEKAQHLLQQETVRAKEALNTSHSLKERLATVKDCLAHLTNLKKNLRFHDVAIEHFNQRFIFGDKVVGCSNHQEILDQVRNKILELSELENKLHIELMKQQKEKIKLFNSALDQLQLNLENGLVMDKETLLRSYPQYLEKAGQLGVQDNERVMARLHQILNQAYLAHLLAQIDQKQMPVPKFIQILLPKLGVMGKAMQEAIVQAREQFLAKLQKYQNTQKFSESPSEFVSQIQRDLFTVVTDQLSPSHTQRGLVHGMFEKLYVFETETQAFMGKAEQKTRILLRDEILNFKVDSEQKNEQTILLEKWGHISFPNPFVKALNQFLTQLDFNQIQSALQSEDAETCQANLVQLEVVFQKMKERWSEKKIDRMYQEKGYKMLLELIRKDSVTSTANWFEKNAHAQQFSFNQGQWGYQEILGEGVCCAINYRWIRYLLEKPARRITAEDRLVKPRQDAELVDQLMHSTTYQKARGIISENHTSGVTAGDRMIQAASLLESTFDHIHTGGISKAILKRDHMTYQEFEEIAPTISEMIKIVGEKHSEALNPNQGSGIFHIVTHKFDKRKNTLQDAHALGMQIDPTRDIYRFWDVNSGFYQYSSKREMTIAFEEYMKDAYSGEYNYFLVGQYNRLNG